MIKLDLKEVINFVRWHYLDERLSIVAKHLYSKKTFDVIWTRENSEPEWLIRDRSNEEAPKYVHTNELIDELNKEKVDLVDFQIVIYNKVLLHVAHLNFIIKKATDLFGSEIITDATTELADFYTNLQGAISSILEKTKTPEDKNTTIEEEKKPNKISKLKLVKEEVDDGENP